MTDETIFAEALEKPDAATRAEFVATACADDREQQKRVEGLLAAHDRVAGFLERPAAGMPNEEHASTRAFRAADRVPDDGLTCTQGEGADEDTDDALAFLSPPGRTDSLGRIGHYEVLEVLGKGGFGVVFRAFDDVLQRVVAVKVLAPSMAATSPARKRFLREARSSAAVRHENVVQVHAVEEQPLPHLVMEFVPGETLQLQLDRTGPLELPEILRIGRQLAAGLAAAHEQGLIHRDIKPSNILIDAGPQRNVKLTDFGLARAADDASLTRSGVIAGTPMYMAPEQAKGESLDHRADLFSLGSVLYVMCAGRPPFRAENTLAVLKRVVEHTPRPIREVIPEVPEWLCRVVAKLHEKEPKDRYQTAREVADLLADCEQQLKQHAGLMNYARIPGGKPRQTKSWKWVATAALALLLPLIAWGVYDLTRSGPQPEVVDRGKTDPQTPTPPSTTDEGWVQLFNGKDLTGWKPHPDQPGVWKVQDGAIVGGGAGYLFSERDDFNDFHVRLEAKINNVGDSGIFFRTGQELEILPRGVGQPRYGYEANISHSAVDKTGSLYVRSKGNHAKVTESLISPNEWFAMDVIARGNHFIIKVNDKLVVDHIDSHSAYLKGSLSLQTWNASTVVQFRKIEIKEFPPPEPGWVQLFNGKDLTGWKEGKFLNTGSWRVMDGVLKGHASEQSMIWSDRPNYRDFHLRAEARIEAGGDSGILFRQAPNKGYEADINPGNQVPTGSLWRIEDFKILTTAPAASAPKPGEWFTMEVIARGSRLQVLVNGNTTADVMDTSSSQGHFGLQARGKGGSVEFRKIEIKELPQTTPTRTELLKDAVLLMNFTKFSEKDGKTWVQDLSGRGNDGLCEGVHPTDAGLVGGGLLNDGQGFLRIPRQLLRSQGQLTWTGWYRFKAMNDVHLIATQNARYPDVNTPSFLFYVSDDGRVHINVFGGGGWHNKSTPTKMVEPGVWTFVAFRFQADDKGMTLVRMWVNDKTYDFTLRTIGGGPSEEIVASGLNGTVDEIALWHRALSDAEVRAVYDLGQRGESLGDGPFTPPLAVAPFDAKQAKDHQEGWANHLGVDVEITNTLGMRLRLIPPGEFMMGNSPAEIEAILKDTQEFKEAPGWLQDYVRNEGPDRRVTIPSPFRLAVHEVTVGHFREFVTATKYQTEAEKNGGGLLWNNEAKKFERDPENVWNNPKLSGSESHPVVFINVPDARAFCTWLSEKEEVTYTLPTEEQWEYACRAGTTSRWSFGADEVGMKQHGWTLPHSNGKFYPVGRWAANPFGLFDMHGNAAELAVTPQEAAVERGGRSTESPLRARSAWRIPVEKAPETHFRRGFRVAIVGDLKVNQPPLAPAPRTKP